MLETETTFTLLQDPVQSNVFKKLHNVALTFLQIHDRFTFVHVTGLPTDDKAAKIYEEAPGYF